MVTSADDTTSELHNHYEKIMTTRSDFGVGTHWSSSSTNVPMYLKPLLKKIHPEVQEDRKSVV